jgi:phosphoribosylformimino-5-aminoimidazole carboxamide ribotide isomerase
MIVFPAIDLRGGSCVRLQQGDPDAETIYSEDAVEVAVRWAASGCDWLHIVNLDGAFSGSFQGLRADELPVNLVRLRDIARAVGLSIQLGGGLRSMQDIELALSLGATRVVLGTVAVRQPELVSEVVEQFGAERIVVGIDARDGMVSTSGWQETSSVKAVNLGREMQQRGVRHVVYTDIARDGMLSGVNVSATAILAMQTGLKVIASGGVASLDDILALREVEPSGVEGVIIGKALYTGAIQLEEAISVAGGRL